MPAVKSLTLGLIVLGALCTQSQGASSSWWAWNQAWQAPSNPDASTNAQEVAAQPAAPFLFAVQNYWGPVGVVPPSIQLFTTPAPSSANYGFPYWGYAPAVQQPRFSPAQSATSFAPAIAPQPSYDALINLGEGPFDSEAMLTSGGARPWYESPVVTKAFGGAPDANQRAEFSSTVLGRVEQAFHRSGITNISLTTDPNASAAHTMSVVSGTEYNANPDAIGIANMGGDGFSFIDKLIYADSVDELQWAVAHNVAHELMHTFGVEHHDQTGQFLDSAVAPWEVLVSPDAAFGPEAVQELLATDFRERFDQVGRSQVGNAQEVAHGPQCHDFHCHGSFCHCGPHAMGIISPSPVPEPTTWALWGLLSGAAWVGHRRARGRAAA